MEITEKQFLRFCPAATTPNGNVFKSLGEFLAERMNYIHSLIPAETLEELDKAAEKSLVDPGEFEYSPVRSFVNAIRGYVCTSAFWYAIPHLDLVLTSTGFGVVSNQNLAPASSERVAALRHQLVQASEEYFDDMLDRGRKFVDWRASTKGRELFGSLFWRGEHMRVFRNGLRTRQELAARMPEIEVAAEALKRIYSPELYDALVDIEARGSASEIQEQVIRLSRIASGAWLFDRRAFYMYQADLLSIIEENPEDFPEYMGSQTYMANHSEPYENQKGDSCFFFG